VLVTALVSVPVVPSLAEGTTTEGDRPAVEVSAVGSGPWAYLADVLAVQVVTLDQQRASREQQIEAARLEAERKAREAAERAARVARAARAAARAEAEKAKVARAYEQMQADLDAAYEAVPARADLLRRASALKDVTPFPAGVWRNAGNKMAAWVASDRVVRPGTVRAVAVTLMVKRWPLEEWKCLDRLLWHESSWRVDAGSPERAYGLFQAYPGGKMRSAGEDWRTNVVTQLRWGFGYIEGRYGSPCGAWKFWVGQAENGSHGYGWY
jgi:hypothetical protein